MADIVVDTYRLQEYAQRLSIVNTRIWRLDGRLNGLYTKVGLLDLWNLMVADAMTCYSWRLNRCESYLRQTASDFERVENHLKDLDPTNFNPLVAAWQGMLRRSDRYWNPIIVRAQQALRMQLMPFFIGYGAAESALRMVKSDNWDAFWNGTLGYTKEGGLFSAESEDGETYGRVLSWERSSSFKPDYGKYEDGKILGDEDHLDIKKKQKEYKRDDWQINPEKEWYDDPKGTIFQNQAEEKLKGSVLDGRLAGNGSYAEGSIEGRFLTGEVGAEGAIGLYVYSKNEDGTVTRILSPGVSAAVGASVAVLQGEAHGRLGLGENKDMLGIYGDVDAEVLSAEAEAKIAVNRNEVYAGASAEANIAKVSATGGVSVLGTDLGVSGSLKVGVGAHAEIGVTDGKLKVDVGAAVGVGFDVGFEVDVSGTVDAVCDFAESAVENATDWVNDAWEGATNAVSDLLDWKF